jgi:hypothetical protein
MTMTREQLIEHYVKQWGDSTEYRYRAEQLADKVLAQQAELHRQ